MVAQRVLQPGGCCPISSGFPPRVSKPETSQYTVLPNLKVWNRARTNCKEHRRGTACDLWTHETPVCKCFDFSCTSAGGRSCTWTAHSLTLCRRNPVLFRDRSTGLNISREEHPFCIISWGWRDSVDNKSWYWSCWNNLDPVWIEVLPQESSGLEWTLLCIPSVKVRNCYWQSWGDFVTHPLSAKQDE